MSFPENVNGSLHDEANAYGGWPGAEAYNINEVPRPLPGVPTPAPYNPEADKTVPIQVNAANGFGVENENTIPVRREEINKIDEAQKAQEAIDAKARIEKIIKVSDFAGGILLSMYDDDQNRLANGVSTGPKREPRYVPTIILQELDVPDVSSGKGRLGKLRDAISPSTITKDPQALLWVVPGLSREVGGRQEHVAVAANLTKDQNLPAGEMMIVKGDVARPRSGVPIEAAKATEAFNKKFPDDTAEQLQAYFAEDENNFRALSIEPWTPASQHWDGEKIESNSSFGPEEILEALRNFWTNNRLSTAGRHFGFQVAEKL